MSLLLCFATAALWVRSYFIADCFYRGTWERGDEIHIARGAVALELLTISQPRPEWRYFQAQPSRVNATASDTGDQPDLRILGFEWSPGVNLFAVPLWFIMALTAILPAVWICAFGRASKIGGCVCRYDLTGNVSGVCPECGTPIPARK